MGKAEIITFFNSQVDIALEVKGFDPMKEPIEYHIANEWYVKSQAEDDLDFYIEAAIDILKNRDLDIKEILDIPIKG